MNPLPPSQLTVRLHGSGDIRLEDVPIPHIQDPDDVIVRITLCGLCGSDLHAYRGLEPFDKPYICGHEFVGQVVALGTAFHAEANNRPTLYRNLKLQDTVFSPFTVSCSECEYCRFGFSSRCIHSQLFGSPSLPGAQSQYIRVPKAGGTLLLASDFPDLVDDDAPLLLLLADILPTGYFAVSNALNHPNLAPFKDSELRFAIVGLGPVGLCALVTLLDKFFSTSRPVTILAIDPNPSRRQRAEEIIEDMNIRNPLVRFEALGPDLSLERVSKTSGGGVHAVCEMVGNDSALKLAYDLIRPFGVISSIGVHTSAHLPLSGGDLYDKNVSLSFGRCPVRSIVHNAYAVLARQKDALRQVIEKIVPLSQAKESYEDFNKGIGGKILFDPMV